ncbi:efflux RND transporter periplasmic adaptor subunit [Adhaeribacter sp. BT258]|uniref:Efflux RND transporter periplasmic adaptor subunit n=1 Tax=Adhaeribacter terrigena TaxID=2793070 RepID=A0ABS1C4P9_9BACT|nr:efflux RND transporter periplasmic adaptor subunit [Adhaeribacter terrigena]MBK0404366.1 efflux RND transporter periplasmic adaptor subunit [Adhaeribacter terrigena]
MRYRFLPFLKTQKVAALAPVFLLLFLSFFSGCNSAPQEEKPAETETTAAPENPNEVTLTDAQFKSSGIAFWQVEQKNISTVLRLNGMLDVPPQNLISVSAPLGGFVKETDLLQGMKLRKGQILAVLQNPEYVTLQQEYLDAKSKLAYQELEFARQKELSEENVSSKKTFQQTTAEYQQLRNRAAALKEQLALLNINPNKLTSGNISSTIRIYSPINGFVKNVLVNTGKFVSPQDVLFELVNTEHMHAELTVFEKDIAKLKQGQKIKLTFPNLPGHEIPASVYLVGRSIEADKTIRVHAHLDKEDPELLPGMYVTALVEINAQTVPALPEDAIVQAEGKHVIFVAKNARTFEMVPVEIGATKNGYTEVKLPESVPASAKIVTKGAYHVLAKKLNVGEE